MVQTPWGKSDYTKVLYPGIVWYGTPSHGGVHVAPSFNATIHAAWRNPDGWYEEDEDWAVVAHHFPNLFPGETARALRTLIDWKPDAYQVVTGERLRPEESYILRQRAFQKSTRDKMVCVAAIQEGKMVRVTACIGGRREDGKYASPDMHVYLVPPTDYRIPYIVDTAKYPEVLGT